MKLPEYYEFKCPAKTCSGLKAIEQLPNELSALNSIKPLIITNKNISEKELPEKITDAFKSFGLTLGIYDGVPEKPTVSTIKELTSIFNNGGFDAIIGLGNKHIIDTAKVLNIVVSNKPELINSFEGEDNIPSPLKPFVLISVSTGNGTEVTKEASLDGMQFSSHYLMPDIVVIDPRMLMKESPFDSINTAMAALTHSIEAYTVQPANPLTNTYAHSSINFIMEHLIKVVKNSMKERSKIKEYINEFKIREHRVALTNGASMGGCAYSNAPKGIAHKLGVEISKYCDFPEGICMGIMIQYILEFKSNRKSINLEKLFLPLAGIDLYSSTPEGQRFDSAVGMIRFLQNELYNITSTKIPRTLEDAKIPREKFQEIAENVADDEYDKEKCLLLLEHAYEGKPVTP